LGCLVLAVADRGGGPHLKKKGTGGCAPIIVESHCSASSEKIRPGCCKGGSSQLTNLQEEQYGFRPDCGIVDQLVIPLQGCWRGASWEFPHPVYMCFVDLEKAYDRVPRGILWGVLREYGVPGPLIRAIWSLYHQVKHVLSGCLTPPRLSLVTILFMIFMDRISRRSRGEESVRFGELLFADDVVLLASSYRDLQHALGILQLSVKPSG